MLLTLFCSSQSISLQCDYITGSWDTLGTIYWCNVQNAVDITSPNAAQVDSTSGVHKSGYKNDNVEAITVSKGQIHYFPRGLNKFFKNLKGIQIGNTGLKEMT